MILLFSLCTFIFLIWSSLVYVFISLYFGQIRATGISSLPYVILYDPLYPAYNHVGLELCKASF